TVTLMTRLVYRRSRVVTMPLAISYVPVIDANQRDEAKSDGGTSARSRDEIAPPTLTTPPMRASAWAPTTRPGPMRSRPVPDSVFQRSAEPNARAPVRSRGPD